MTKKAVELVTSPRRFLQQKHPVFSQKISDGKTVCNTERSHQKEFVAREVFKTDNEMPC